MILLDASSGACSFLLDINLPDMSGAEITRRLHSDYPALKILAISAENSAETIKEMIEAGCYS